jgi:antirestriction protein ArdC
MPDRHQFTRPEFYYGTMFHEQAHATGHASRLDREGIAAPHRFGDEVYSREELVAELTAAFLCAKVGIEQDTIKNSAAYIANWSAALREDPKCIVQAASAAQKAADWMIGTQEEEAALPEAA